MAYWAGEAGDKIRQLDLNLQAAQMLGQMRAYGDLVTVLGNLGGTAETKAQAYLAQALWLCLRIQSPLVNAIVLVKTLYERVPQGDELEALLAAMALYFCAQRGQGHPQLAQLQERSREMLLGAAGAQGVATQEAFDAWFAQQRLNDSAFVLSQLSHRLEGLIGEGWVFDPSLLKG